MYLERDANNPHRVWVKPDRHALPWFCIDPVKCQIHIQARGRRELLDIDEIKKLALELVLPIDNTGNV